MWGPPEVVSGTHPGLVVCTTAHGGSRVQRGDRPDSAAELAVVPGPRAVRRALAASASAVRRPLSEALPRTFRP
eukprot:7046635-Alexandrium_andersonii.AAC.1